MEHKIRAKLERSQSVSGNEIWGDLSTNIVNWVEVIMNTSNNTGRKITILYANGLKGKKMPEMGHKLNSRRPTNGSKKFNI